MRHTQEHEAHEGKGEHSVALAEPGPSHACTSCARGQLGTAGAGGQPLPSATVAGIITDVYSPVNAALGRHAPRLRAFPICSRGPPRARMPLDSLLAGERGVRIPPEMF